MKPSLTVSLTAVAILATTFAIVALANSAGASGIDASSTSKSAAKKAALETARSTDRRALIERGRYIVHGVGLCIDCHSPRNERGEFIEGKALTGSMIPMTPTIPIPWAGAAPRIAGIPAGYTAEDMVHFLMTGERPHSQPPVRPPMPPYRMSREDAEAVVAYVSSLPAGTP